MSISVFGEKGTFSRWEGGGGGHPAAVCGAIENGEWWVVVTHFTFILCLHETTTSQK